MWRFADELTAVLYLYGIDNGRATCQKFIKQKKTTCSFSRECDGRRLAVAEKKYNYIFSGSSIV